VKKLAEASEKPHTLQRWDESEYTNKIYVISTSPGKLPPFRRFIKGKRDVNNVYESLQIPYISLQEAGSPHLFIGGACHSKQLMCSGKP
jgi:hypothetical protein